MLGASLALRLYTTRLTEGKSLYLTPETTFEPYQLYPHPYRSNPVRYVGIPQIVQMNGSIVYLGVQSVKKVCD